MEEGSDGPHLTCSSGKKKTFPIKAHWQETRAAPQEREEPEVHGRPKRAAESNTSENSTSAAMFSPGSSNLCTAQLLTM